MKKIVVFDFDGTLSWPDTNVEFQRFAMRRSVWPWICLPLTIFGVLMKYVSANAAWRRNLARRYQTKKLLARLGPDFIRHHLRNRFGWAAEQVARERAMGNFVVLVSASPDYFVRPLVKDMGFDLIVASVMDKKRPWRLKFLCYGENKVAALDRAIKSYKIIRAYADSKSDLPIMSKAAEQVWINPRTGCRKS